MEKTVNISYREIKHNCATPAEEYGYIRNELHRHFKPNEPINRRESICGRYIIFTGEAKEEENLDYLEWI